MIRAGKRVENRPPEEYIDHMIFRIGFCLLSYLLFAASPDAAELVVYRNTRTKREVPYAGNFSNGRVVQIPATMEARKVEMRGLWFATVENLDFPTHGTAPEFRLSVAERFEKARKANFNAVFFQVRPSADAFYPSVLNPYSRFLSGVPGRAIPGLDPLAELIFEARKQNLQFHAWLNPYRVVGNTRQSKAAFLAALPANSFARKNPGMVLEIPLSQGERMLILDPGEPAVMRHIVDTIIELASKYPIDGIVFDDYFYPYTPIGDLDMATYRNNNTKNLSRDDWRRDNVNRVIYAIYYRLGEINRKKVRKVEFGISPFGIWANTKTTSQGSLTGGSETYTQQYADVRKWIKMGWLDYVVPQIYWPFEHKVAAYAALTDWWAEQVRGTRARLYIGHTVQEFGKAAWSNPAEVIDQMRYNQKHPEIQGSVFFAYRGFFAPANEAQRAGAGKVLGYYAFSPASAPRPRPPGL